VIALAESGTAATTDSPLSTARIIASLQQTVSPSRLTLFLGCRLKFWFRYVARLVKPKTAALHVGSAVHAVLKAWNKARWRQTPLTLTQLHQEYARAWADTEEPVAWAAGEEDDEKKTGWRLVETYFRESKIPPELRPEAVEVPVEAVLHQHGLPTLIGVLDLVQAGRIIDFKTSSTTPNPEKVAHTTEVQTSSYAVLYREATGRRETGIELHHLVKLKNPKLVMTALPPMSDNQQTRLFRLMEAYVEGLEREDFVPSPGMRCVSCEFFNECRAWS
jgi:putative RecB family exonuclease